MTDTRLVSADEPKFKLSLKGEGITVEQDVPAAVARDIIAIVLGGAPSTRGARGTPMSQASGTGSNLSIREFVDEAGAKKNPHIVTAIGQYLIDVDGQERFTRAEVKAKFAKAGEPTPANISRDMAHAASSGWVAENPRGQFYVTDTGRRAIEAKFEGQQIRRPRRRTATKTTAKKKER